MSNIPPLLDEAYSGDIDNYRLGLTYELSYVDYPGSHFKPIDINSILPETSSFL